MTNKKTTDENEMTLRDWIIRFREDDGESLHKLIKFTTVKYGDDYITRMSFTNKHLNNLLFEMRKKYRLISSEDVDAFMMIALFGDTLKKSGEKKGVFYEADVEKYEEKQVAKWCTTRVDYRIQELIHKESLFSENIITDEKIGANGEVESHFDDYSFGEWTQEIENDSKYSKFIEAAGGMEKILSSRQYEVYYLAKNHTQEEVGQRLGIAQSTVSELLQKAGERIKRGYMDFQTYSLLTSDSSNYDEINQFLETYENVMICDPEDKFDYYTYVSNWLKENIVHSDFNDDYAMEFANRSSNKKQTIVDVLFDNIKDNQREVFYRVLSAMDRGQDMTPNKRDKDKIVMGTLRAFNLYIKAVDKSISEVNKRIVEDVKDYDDIAEIFTE